MGFKTIEWQSSAEDRAAWADTIGQIDEQYAAVDWDALADAGYDKHGDYCFVYSYPPVRTLKPISTDDLFRASEWERETDSINLYLHIPYCTGICSYCYFARVRDDVHAPVGKDKYVDLLIWEIEDKFRRLGRQPQIKTIHFGGGTPSTLEPQQIERIMAYLRGLDLAPGVEVTFECAPETIADDPDKLASMRESGVNRINVGVESTDDRVLKAMGRRHVAAVTERAIRRVRETGFDNLNIDLIYALPKQDLVSWMRTLDEVAEWGLESISVYRLRQHPMKAISKLDRSMYPSYEEGLRMQLAHGTMLAERGYGRVQSHKYAIADEKMQQQTERKRGVSHTQLLSAGCGAYGFLNGTFYWNTKSLAQYGVDVRRGEHPTWMGKVLDKDDLMRKSFVLGVHTSRGIDLDAFRAKFGVEPTAIFGAQLSKLVELGLMAVVDDHVRPTELGYFFGDEISTQFYSDAAKAQLAELGMQYGMFFDQDRYA